jgi:hypothetical protein
MVSTLPAEGWGQEAAMQLDLDELWPDSASLVGMQFETPDAFARAQALLEERLDLYRWVWEDALTIAVRQTDLHVLADAGLAYTEIEIVDPPACRTEEERALEREGLKRAMAWWLKELGWAK